MKRKETTCTEYGCPELCRCFCDSDDISYTGPVSYTHLTLPTIYSV